MKKYISIFILCCLIFVPTYSFGLDKFLNYKNTTSASHTDEDVPVTPDVNYALKQGYMYTNVLAANVAEVVTVPTGAKYVVINSTANLWVKVGGAATVPAGDTTNNTGSELNPSIRYLDTSTTIGIISESAAKVSLMFYK